MRRKFYRAFKSFLRTTTLHGFKYFFSPHYLDRVGWIACTWASVCCAVVLCSVLWARFQHAPLLLTEVPLVGGTDRAYAAPTVAICPSPYRTAQLLAENLSMDLKELHWLPILFSKILRGRPASTAQRLLLDKLLDAHNLTLAQALMSIKSPCKELVRKCMLLSSVVPCSELFADELRRWGLCCVMRAERFSQFHTLTQHVQHSIESTMRLDMSLDCYIRQNYYSHCCEFFIKYHDEDWLGPWHLMSGYSHTAYLEFTSIQDVVKDKLVDGGTCVSRTLYSRSQCKIVCKETECGCSHPLRQKKDFETDLPPPCSVVQMKCLGNFVQDNKNCNCLPACQRIKGQISMDKTFINEYINSFNPIYGNVNSNSSIVLNIRIRLSDSNSYDLMPTETWVTLLSSLGGVFNMFLGVGLFSVLELVVLLAVRLPLAFCRSTQLPVSLSRTTDLPYRH